MHKAEGPGLRSRGCGSFRAGRKKEPKKPIRKQSFSKQVCAGLQPYMCRVSTQKLSSSRHYGGCCDMLCRTAAAQPQRSGDVPERARCRTLSGTVLCRTRTLARSKSARPLVLRKDAQETGSLRSGVCIGAVITAAVQTIATNSHLYRAGPCHNLRTSRTAEEPSWRARATCLAISTRSLRRAQDLRR